MCSVGYPIESFEGRPLYGSVAQSVVPPFHGGKPPVPLSRVLASGAAQVTLQTTINHFYLPIGLWVVCRQRP